MSLITLHLYLGSAQEARDIKFLRAKRVHTIVNCARELPDFFPENFEYIRLDLDDDPRQDLSHMLAPVANAIIHAMKNGKVVFVHCAAGISRSSSIVIYTIMKFHKWNFDRAFRFVRDLHPQANPNPGFVQQLVEHNAPGQQQNIPVATRGGNTSSETRVDFGMHGPLSGTGLDMSGAHIELIDGPGGVPGSSVPLPQDPRYGTRDAGYQPPTDVYERVGGMAGMADPTQPPPKNKAWSKLTFDCPECELPEYATGGGRGIYARIFS